VRLRRFLVTITDNEPVDNLDIQGALSTAAADAFGEAVSGRVTITVATYGADDFVAEPGTSHMVPVAHANCLRCRCADPDRIAATQGTDPGGAVNKVLEAVRRCEEMGLPIHASSVWQVRAALERAERVDGWYEQYKLADAEAAQWRQRAGRVEAIAQEADRQDAKWGQQDHSPERWFAILGEEFGEVGREVTKWIPPRGREPDPANYRTELIQLAAVALRMLESFDRSALLSEVQP
jgi:NTP pyrophosphatase (non-canonical NTP hydrolase)